MRFSHTPLDLTFDFFVRFGARAVSAMSEAKPVMLQGYYERRATLRYRQVELSIRYRVSTATLPDNVLLRLSLDLCYVMLSFGKFVIEERLRSGRGRRRATSGDAFILRGPSASISSRSIVIGFLCDVQSNERRCNNNYWCEMKN